MKRIFGWCIVLTTLFVAYKVAGIGGIILSIIPIIIFTSIYFSMKRKDNFVKNSDDGWEEPESEDDFQNTQMNEDKIIFSRDTGPSFQNWAGGPYT